MKDLLKHINENTAILLTESKIKFENQPSFTKSTNGNSLIVDLENVHFPKGNIEKRFFIEFKKMSESEAMKAYPESIKNVQWLVDNYDSIIKKAYAGYLKLIKADPETLVGTKPLTKNQFIAIGRLEDIVVSSKSKIYVDYNVSLNTLREVDFHFDMDKNYKMFNFEVNII